MHDPVVNSVCYIEIKMNTLGSLNIYCYRILALSTSSKHNIAFINRICIIMSKFAFMRMLGRITTPNKQSPACVTVWDLKNLCKVFQKMIAFNQKFFL